MEKKTFMQKLKNMGPAAIITSAFIGPGTITTATLVGVKFQYALLWAVVFSGIALIVLMEMSSRIAIASHKNVIDAAIALKPESRGWRLFVQIFVGLAVGISCFAFQSGNEIGASAGLQDITGMPQWVSALIIGVIALIAALASNKVLETIMQVFVSVMGVLFLVTAIAVAPNLGQVVTGLVPVVPEGGLMNTMALIGTTLIGMNLILHSITSQGKYTSIEELPDARFDIRFNIIIGIIITASILITSGTVLYGTGTSVNGALTFTKSLEPVLGSWARVVGDIGLLAARSVLCYRSRLHLQDHLQRPVPLGGRFLLHQGQAAGDHRYRIWHRAGHGKYLPRCHHRSGPGHQRFHSSLYRYSAAGHCQ